MRKIEYELMPEAFGSNGSFMTKKGTVAELIIDTGMLNADYDKVIPSHCELNKLLMRGMYPRAGDWQGIELTAEEYMEVVRYLTSLVSPKPYRTNDFFYEIL